MSTHARSHDPEPPPGSVSAGENFGIGLGWAVWGLTLALVYYALPRSGPWPTKDTILSLFFLRVPLLLATFLTLLPWIGTRLLPSMLGNLFVLQNTWRLAFVVFGAFTAGLATVTIFNVTYANAAERFGLASAPFTPNMPWYAWAVPLALPVLVTATRLSVSDVTASQGETIAGTEASASNDVLSAARGWLLGTGMAMLFAGVFLLTAHQLNVLETNAEFELLLHQLAPKIDQEVTLGYGPPGQLETDHLKTGIFFGVSLVNYVFCYFFFRPKLGKDRGAATLFFVLSIALGLGLIFGGAAFFLDAYRIPVLLCFLAITTTLWAIFRVDHFYALVPEQGEKPGVEAFSQALTNRLAHQPKGDKTLVVVCASGGGIQAAGWTARVLTGLQERLGEDFTRAIGLISSASGGSVGTMYYLDRFNDDGVASPEQLTTIFDAATHDSLDVTGWGLAYPDLWRLLGASFLAPRLEDRGTVIEIDWKNEMLVPTTRLSNWRKRILGGELPIPVFNATLVEDGRRFLLSPMTFPTSESSSEYSVDFNRLFPEWDIDATTAARLSATFPYVTPICRNVHGAGFHYIADGGYFDNFGVFTAAEWLDNVVLPDPLLEIRRVLFLEISAFPKQPRTAARARGDGWAMSTLGPLLALAAVRNSTQGARNTTEVEQLCHLWKHRVTIERHLIQFPCLDGAFVGRRGNYEPPLSWKLSRRQKSAIDAAWTQLCEDPDSAVAGVAKTWKTWTSAERH